MGNEGHDFEVSGWHWSKHTSRASGIEMLKITYYGDLSDQPINEYLTIKHDGYAGQKAMRNLIDIASESGAVISFVRELDDLCQVMNTAKHPAMIEYRKNGKFYEVMNRKW